jgi:hypothetical protein
MLDPLDDKLGDPVAAAQFDRMMAIVIDRYHLDLTAIARIDGAWSIDDTETGMSRKARARMYESGVPIRNRHRDPGRQYSSFTRL